MEKICTISNIPKRNDTKDAKAKAFMWLNDDLLCKQVDQRRTLLAEPIFSNKTHLLQPKAKIKLQTNIKSKMIYHIRE